VTSAPPWFLVPRSEWSGEFVSFPPDESHHAVRVLRVGVPDVVTVTDGAGVMARCAVERIEDDRVVARILDTEELRTPKPQLVVYQGAAKGRKVDEIVDRLAELGVSETWVYASKRTIVDWDKDKWTKQQERWRSIARGAAKQSRSPFVLDVGGGLSWTELTRRIAREPLTIALWEEASLPMRSALVDEIDRLAVVVGPEGGFEREEAEALADAGAQLVSLGPRILRTELAPVVAASALMWHYGSIG
jgi:16S rRNA (uracil1498-N3)-methyltransferase